MLDLVETQNCWFSHAQAHIFSKINESSDLLKNEITYADERKKEELDAVIKGMKQRMNKRTNE